VEQGTELEQETEQGTEPEVEQGMEQEMGQGMEQGMGPEMGQGMGQEMEQECVPEYEPEQGEEQGKEQGPEHKQELVPGQGQGQGLEQGHEGRVVLAGRDVGEPKLGVLQQRKSEGEEPPRGRLSAHQRHEGRTCPQGARQPQAPAEQRPHRHEQPRPHLNVLEMWPRAHPPLQGWLTVLHARGKGQGSGQALDEHAE